MYMDIWCVGVEEAIRWRIGLDGDEDTYTF